jgi:hypothetical protein
MDLRSIDNSDFGLVLAGSRKRRIISGWILGPECSLYILLL